MLVSFYILSYNHEKMIADAVKAALAQTYSPLQIIISDDCSTDSTWEIIQRTTAKYKGPHSLIIRRNSVNLGISLHINTVWAECAGDWIIASAGDDTSVPERTESVMKEVLRNREIKLVQSWLREVDENNRLLSINQLNVQGDICNQVYFSITDRLSRRTYHQHGAAMSYSREVVDHFGPLPAGVIFEDNILNIRAELLGLVMILKLPLVNHKNHGGQVTRTLSGVSDRTREARRELRLLSDCNSCKQNLIDIRNSQRLSNEIRIALKERFITELVKRTGIRDAVIGPWPFKLIAVYSISRNFSINVFRNDDLMRALLPYFLYRIVRRFRG